MQQDEEGDAVGHGAAAAAGLAGIGTAALDAEWTAGATAWNQDRRRRRHPATLTAAVQPGRACGAAGMKGMASKAMA